jgi:outer membrane protein OmpA-like peptidoglycan-associated protein
VGAERLTVRGAGADEPVAPNDTEEHRQQNRRAEITVDGR